jgi:hypothetical protein
LCYLLCCVPIPPAFHPIQHPEHYSSSTSFSRRRRPTSWSLRPTFVEPPRVDGRRPLVTKPLSNSRPYNTRPYYQRCLCGYSNTVLRDTTLYASCKP